jgi:glyoxylase-like metal-dependent hydrolase (beta-lactamase superfamily II)
MKSTRESDHLYRLTQMGMVNCFFVTEEDGLTLIDTNLFGSAAAIIVAAERIGSPIRRIVLTHAHIDHASSLSDLCKRLPEVEWMIGKREAKLLAGDFSLELGETGKKLFGFFPVNLQPTRLLNDGDRVGSLQVVTSAGHTPGHTSYFDTRDDSLIAGDAFTTQTGLVAAGVFKPFFPFPAIFSWNPELCARSAQKLRELNPKRLAVGHGCTLENPVAAMDQAVELAFQQCEKGMLD